MLPIVTNTPSITDAPAALGLILSILLTVLVFISLLLREYFDAAGKEAKQWRVDILDIAIVPLLCAFAVLVTLRIMDLVGLD